MRILITGATGLIGRHLIERLAPGHELIGIARRDPPQELAGLADWIRQDLAEPIAAKRLPERVDGIVHLAQSERYRDFPEDAEDVFAVNVHSTLNLLEYARRTGSGAFVLASTGGSYGPAPDPIAEDAPVPAPGPYFRSKRMAELLVENYADLIGGAVLRLFFVYGPGQGEMLVMRLAERIAKGEEIVIEGDPGMKMNPIHAGDVAATVEAALALERQEVINVAGDEVVSVTDLVVRLAAALGTEAAIRHTDAATGDLVADTTRMKDRLGVSPGTSLDEGLVAVARWIGAAPDLHASQSE